MTGGAGAGTLAARQSIPTRMTGLPVLLLCLLGMTLVTSGFPQPRLPHLHRCLMKTEWLPVTQSQLGKALVKGWPGDWSSDQEPSEEKRNIVVADDAAFREKSKFLIAMERQKWLNSYIHKLLVVNSQ